MMREIAVGLHRKGLARFKSFIDSDFQEEFGWTAAAFEPMTREQGREFFKDLRLA